MITAFDTNLHSQVRTGPENTLKVCISFFQPHSCSITKLFAYLQTAGVGWVVQSVADTEDKFTVLPLLLRCIDWVGEKGAGA